MISEIGEGVEVYGLFNASNGIVIEIIEVFFCKLTVVMCQLQVLCSQIILYSLMVLIQQMKRY